MQQKEVMTLEEKEEGKVFIVKILEKNFDVNVASGFKARIAALIKKGSHQIAIDVAEVEFIDSCGLGAIIASLKALEGVGDLVICGAAPEIMSIFKLTRLDSIFRVFPDTQAAVAFLSR